MRAFREWLEQIGLAHCHDTLQANGIDFDSASYLTREDLRRLGLNLGDSLKLLNAIAGRGQPARAFVGELRQLTVMFCDWVGYTAVSHHLVRQGKHEELVALRQTFVNTCTDAVARFGGSVVQVSGDGLMIYFGLPAAGDDAERGIRGALATLDALKAVATVEPINVRIGIATGPVVVGVPSGFGGVDAGLAVGETPNLAQRFQSVAGVNEIVIAHEHAAPGRRHVRSRRSRRAVAQGIDGHAPGVAGGRRATPRAASTRRTEAPRSPHGGKKRRRPGAAPREWDAGARPLWTRRVDLRRPRHRQVAADRGAARTHRVRSPHDAALPVLAVSRQRGPVSGDRPTGVCRRLHARRHTRAETGEARSGARR